MGFPVPELSLQKDVPLRFRFGVFFFIAGVIPNPLDIRFQTVRGLTATVSTKPLPEGGQNLYTQKLPERVNYGNLILERGMVVASPLNLEFNAAMTLFKFRTSSVLVTLFNEEKIPVSGWFFYKAFPVKWSTSDLGATEKSVVVDTLELAYTRMQIMRI